MSEPELNKEASENPQQSNQEEDEVSWEDAIEDLNRQKQMINAQAQKQKLEETSPVEDEISWEDAIEDLERQKQMINAHGRGETPATMPSPQAEPAHPVSVAEEQQPNLQFILDIPLQVTVELGRKRLLVNELLQLNQGSIIELSRQIGEPFDILVNQKLIARGEVVVIEDRFGIKITEVIGGSVAA